MFIIHALERAVRTIKQVTGDYTAPSCHQGSGKPFLHLELDFGRRAQPQEDLGEETHREEHGVQARA